MQIKMILYFKKHVLLMVKEYNYYLHYQLKNILNYIINNYDINIINIIFYEKNVYQFFFLLVGVDAYLLYNDIVGKFSGIRIYLVELYILTISLTSEFS